MLGVITTPGTAGNRVGCNEGEDVTEGTGWSGWAGTGSPACVSAYCFTAAIATAPHDEAVAEQERAATAIYRSALVPIAERLIQLGDMRPGIDAAATTDLLWFYFGYSSHFTLHDDNGWSYERAERWLADQAIAALLCWPGQASPSRHEPALNS